MQRFLPTSILLAVASFGAADEASVTPVQKVIRLMNGMLEKGKKEKHDEQVQFAAFKQFCDDTTVEKRRAIEEANEKIDVLKADIQKAIATAERLGKEIAAHDEDISVWNGDIKQQLRSASWRKLITMHSTRIIQSPLMLFNGQSPC